MKKVKAAFRGIVIFLLCVIEIYPLFWMLPHPSRNRLSGVRSQLMR